MPEVSRIVDAETCTDGVLQGSPEWHSLRCGKVTASRMADMTAKVKSGWGSSRANYASELVVERLSGCPSHRFQSAEMLHGNEEEPNARLLYEMMKDTTVSTVGFVPHPTIPMAGCSPDGLVGADGLVEIKCPSSKTHLDTLLSESVPEKYLKQMAFQMSCTGRAWCDFVSYDPRMPGDMQIWIKRVHRDEKLIAELEAATKEFLAEVDATVSALLCKYRQREAAE